METAKYNRKSFIIDAVQVTSENMKEVAEWCGGEQQIEGEIPQMKQFIRVNVHRPLNDRQTKAYVGDWVLQAGSGFKVYTNKAFMNCFEPVQQSHVVRRDAGSGEFVTAEEAAAHPDTTVTEKL